MHYSRSRASTSERLWLSITLPPLSTPSPKKAPRLGQSNWTRQRAVESKRRTCPREQNAVCSRNPPAGSRSRTLRPKPVSRLVLPARTAALAHQVGASINYFANRSRPRWRRGPHRLRFARCSLTYRGDRGGRSNGARLQRGSHQLATIRCAVGISRDRPGVAFGSVRSLDLSITASLPFAYCSSS
jgi:hypothetical protein